MKKAFSGVALDVTAPPRAQVQEQIRELVVSGRLKPGQRLPSTEALAKRWKTYVPAVHDALTGLVKEGLLVRHQGRGTFVRPRVARLTCMGIYDKASYGGSLYSQALHAALRRELTEAGIELDVWIDPRPEEQWNKPWPPLVRAAVNRKFQALIVVATSDALLPWQRKLAVATAFQSTANIPNRVSTDNEQLAEVGLAALARQGCRSVGLIAPVYSTITNADGSRHEWLDFYEHFVDRARDLGLQVRNEWVRLPPPNANDPRRRLSQEEFGYREFLALWRQPAKPDGLFITTDTVARGVILGLSEQHVRVPAELKLVLHKNESIDLLCPVPATLLVSSEREVARALIEQVQKQFRGEVCEPMLLPFRVVAHAASR